MEAGVIVWVLFCAVVYYNYILVAEIIKSNGCHGQFPAFVN